MPTRVREKRQRVRGGAEREGGNLLAERIHGGAGLVEKQHRRMSVRQRLPLVNLPRKLIFKLMR